MVSIFKKIQSASTNRSTYKVGLLQAKAYRILKQHTTEALSKHDISTIEWAFLGILYESKEGMRSSELADELGVEAPFVTTLFAKLKKMNFAESIVDPIDSRAKLICITDKGEAFVSTTETFLREHVKPLLVDISVGDLLSYMVVLEKMIENSKTQFKD